MIEVHNLSEQDVEQIAYETAYLFTTRWIRDLFEDTDCFKEIKNNKQIFIKKIGIVWVKDGFQREICRGEVISGEDSGSLLTVDWFDRESAFWLQQESKV